MQSKVKSFEAKDANTCKYSIEYVTKKDLDKLLENFKEINLKKHKSQGEHHARNVHEDLAKCVLEL